MYNQALKNLVYNNVGWCITNIVSPCSTQINNHFNNSEKNTGTTKQSREPGETDTITDIY